jgi:ribosomal protein S2
LFNVLVKDRYAQILIVNTLLVGTNKKISSNGLQYALEKSNIMIPYILNWFPGMLTNHKYTFTHSQTSALINKKKGVKKNKYSMIKNKKGVNNLVRFPSVAIFFSAYGRFCAGINEASVLGIPTIGIMDSDSTFSTLDFYIPSNDDSYSSVLYFFNLFSETIIRGFRNNLLCTDKIFGLESSIDAARGFVLKNYRETYLSHSWRIWKVLKKIKRIDVSSTVVKYGKLLTKIGLIVKILKFFFIKVKKVKQLAIRKKIKKVRDYRYYYSYYYRNKLYWRRRTRPYQPYRYRRNNNRYFLNSNFYKRRETNRNFYKNKNVRVWGLRGAVWV